MLSLWVLLRENYAENLRISFPAWDDFRMELKGQSDQ